MIDLILYTASVFLFFAFAGAVAWSLDKLLTFHLEGMERVRKLDEREGKK
jgi:hypothetical protein